MFTYLSRLCLLAGKGGTGCHGIFNTLHQGKRYDDWTVRDFANRTRYILSELDNVEAGRPVEHPEQIPDYRKPSREGGGFFSPYPILLDPPF